MSFLLSSALSPSDRVQFGLGSTTAIGDDAAAIRQSLDDAGVGGPHSIYTQRMADAFVALLEACESASETGWDGYHGTAADAEAFVVAEAFLRTVPSSLPMPDIAVHPDGQIGFDWLFDRNRMLSVAVDGAGTVAYAGRSGTKKVTGREEFVGVFPPSVRFHLVCLQKSITV